MKFQIEILIRKIFGEKFVAYNLNYNKFYLFTNIFIQFKFLFQFVEKIICKNFSFHQNALGQNVELQFIKKKKNRNYSYYTINQYLNIIHTLLHISINNPIHPLEDHFLFSVPNLLSCPRRQIFLCIGSDVSYSKQKWFDSTSESKFFCIIYIEC